MADAPCAMPRCRCLEQELEPHAHPSTPDMLAFYMPGHNQPPALRRVPRPMPHQDEALIRVHRAGICGTDLAMLQHYKQDFVGILGHEFVGCVVAIGSGPLQASQQQRWLGQRVVGELNVPCDDPAKCRVCRAHAAPRHCEDASPPASDPRADIRYRNHCPFRQALGIVHRDGAFAEYLTLPLANLHVVPDDVPDRIAVFTEPLAAAYRVVEQGVIQPMHRVAILGDGRLGLLVAEVLAAAQIARAIEVFGKHADKLALVEQVVSHVHVLDAAQRLLDAPHLAHAFDVVVETTGSPSGLACSQRLLGPHGTLVVKSTCAARYSPLSIQQVRAVTTAKPNEPCDRRACCMDYTCAATSDVDAPQFDQQQAQQQDVPQCRPSFRILGSRCGPFLPALALLHVAHPNENEKTIRTIEKTVPMPLDTGRAPGTRKIALDKYIEAEYPLAQAAQALAHAGKRGTRKVQLTMHQAVTW